MRQCTGFLNKDAEDSIWFQEKLKGNRVKGKVIKYSFITPTNARLTQIILLYYYRLIYAIFREFYTKI
jgi:hypothetical protein